MREEREYWRRVRRRALERARAKFRLPLAGQIALAAVVTAVWMVWLYETQGAPSVVTELVKWAWPVILWTGAYALLLLYYHYRVPAEFDSQLRVEKEEVEKELTALRTGGVKFKHQSVQIGINKIYLGAGPFQADLTVFVPITFRNEADRPSVIDSFSVFVGDNTTAYKPIEALKTYETHRVEGVQERDSKGPLRDVNIGGRQVVTAYVTRYYEMSSAQILALDERHVVRLRMEAMGQAEQTTDIQVDWNDQRKDKNWLKRS